MRAVVYSKFRLDMLNWIPLGSSRGSFERWGMYVQMSLKLKTVLEIVRSLALEGKASRKNTYFIILAFSMKGKLIFASDQTLCSQTNFSINKFDTSWLKGKANTLCET